MNVIKLAEHDLCTGCGACAAKCPKHCISMQENAIGIVLPEIDAETCVECHSCENVCPILNMPELHKPAMAYAAWSNDEQERMTSASGGVAIELYKYAVENSYAAVGASQNADFSVTHKLVTTIEDLPQFKNSKYVFSDAYGVFPEIKKTLKENRKLIFIGLPCQVAALRKLFKDDEHLLLIEVVCHGTTPYSYLKQHIDMLCKRLGKKTVNMSFRDPYTFTYTYTFTLYDKTGERFYAKRTKDGDTYQFGYHRAVSYRENCYHCRFARPERNADITIADYHGLGRLAPCAYSDRNVSLILVNTVKGRNFLDGLIANDHIHVEQRPLGEPFRGEARLRHPSLKNKYRMIFEKEISISHGDFETAIMRPQQKYSRDMKVKDIVMLPQKVLYKIKNTIIR